MSQTKARSVGYSSAATSSFVESKRGLTFELSGRCREDQQLTAAHRSGPLERIVRAHPRRRVTPTRLGANRSAGNRSRW